MKTEADAFDAEADDLTEQLARCIGDHRRDVAVTALMNSLHRVVMRFENPESVIAEISAALSMGIEADVAKEPDEDTPHVTNAASPRMSKDDGGSDG